MKTKSEILDIGCGNHKVKGSLGLDSVKIDGVDIIHDLNKFPYPFQKNSFKIIYANQVLEHLEAPLDKILEELCRICKPNGIIKIVVPHALSVGGFSDPTHKKFFTYFTFDYFGSNEQSYYTKTKLKIIKKKFVYRTGQITTKLLKPLENLINKIPKIYSHFFAYIFPVSTLYFELKPIK